ncbi:MAG: multiheme c-type cytochrome [Terriglobia bacterium]
MANITLHPPRLARVTFLLLPLLILPALCRVACSQTVTDVRPETSSARSHPKGWWPNEGSAPRSAYAGEQACAACHPSEAVAWQGSQMAHAVKPAGESKFLRAHPHMSYQRGPYTYHIDLEGGQAIYSITGGGNTLSIPLLWAYGTGVVGQAFVFRTNGIYYEAEAAYYPVQGKLSLVAGLEQTIPATPAEAFGLPLAPAAARECISCHTTAAVVSSQLDVEHMVYGVSCEACHGPGAHHAAAMSARGKRSKPAVTFIFNPAKLPPTQLENFCGACHRTSLLVTSEGLHGLDTVHYEPYRLEMSKCWIMTRRITCVTCHNPHQRLRRIAADYDSACLSCHLSKPGHITVSHPGKACPVATRNCVTCHMPKCRLPLAPFTMSDHFIRVVGPGDACAKSS